jgi:ABC-type sugar transport system ATPase subunit
MLDEPTQGVDVGARRDIYAALRATAAAGGSVLVTSSEPEELVQIAHRVIVLSGGRIAAALRAEDIDETCLLSLAHQIEHQGHAA